MPLLTQYPQGLPFISSLAFLPTRVAGALLYRSRFILQIFTTCRHLPPVGVLRLPIWFLILESFAQLRLRIVSGDRMPVVRTRTTLKRAIFLWATTHEPDISAGTHDDCANGLLSMISGSWLRRAKAK